MYIQANETIYAQFATAINTGLEEVKQARALATAINMCLEEVKQTRAQQKDVKVIEAEK